MVQSRDIDRIVILGLWIGFVLMDSKCIVAT